MIGHGTESRASAGLVASAAIFAAGTATAAFLVLALLAVAKMPYFSWDALSFGEWSRLIAQTGRLHFDSLTPTGASRPLFYVLQGWIWRLLGFDEAYGRAFSLLFGLLLVGSVGAVAARTSREGSFNGRAALGVVFLLSIPAVAVGFCAGLTDVPVAALVAACAAALATFRAGAPRALLVAALAAAAVLAKPTALSGLLGLGLACLIGPVSGLGRRMLHGASPLAAGTLLALIYEFREARHFRLDLFTFLVGPKGSYYADAAASIRWKVFWTFDWFGAPLRAILIYSLIFAILRAAGARHRVAAPVSLCGAAILGFFGPGIGAGAATPAGFAAEFQRGGVAPVVAFPLMLALLKLAGRARAGAGNRVEVARLVVWGLPPAVAWLWRAGWDGRLLSPAWPAFVVLAAVSVAPALEYHGRFRLAAAGLIAAALLLPALSNLKVFDGLDDEAGFHAWPRVLVAVRSGRTGPTSLRRAVLGELVDEVGVLKDRAAPEDRIISSDGRLRFFFPGRVAQRFPRGCAALRGYRFFVLRTDRDSRTYAETQVGVSGDPAFWETCRDPQLERVATLEGAVVYRIEK